jgi:hypothetical protein
MVKGGLPIVIREAKFNKDFSQTPCNQMVREEREGI